jgi:hypothetical protein
MEQASAVDGTSISCFRPALVGNDRRGPRIRFTWSGKPRSRIQTAP